MNRTNKLTEQAIKRAKPKDKKYKLTDGDSMYLRICPDGKKYWQLQLRFEVCIIFYADSFPLKGI